MADISFPQPDRRRGSAASQLLIGVLMIGYTRFYSALPRRW